MRWRGLPKRMHKNRRTQPHWIIEEASASAESSFIIIHPYADVENLAACCQQMRSPNLKRMYVIVDSRTAVTQTQSFLETLSASLEGVEVVVRFAHPRIIMLILHLWRQMQNFCERRSVKAEENDK